MRTILLSLSLVLLIAATSSCTRDVSNKQPEVDTAMLRIEVPTMAYLKEKGFVKYEIGAGKHVAKPSPVQLLNVEEMAFYFMFDSSAIYTSKTLENQYDINKLWGFSEGVNHHDNSARWGWNWLNGQLFVHPYTYVNGERKEQNFLWPVAIGRIHYATIKVEDSTYLFTINGVEHRAPRGARGSAKEYQLYPFFGGNEPAPHDVTIWIKTLYL